MKLKQKLIASILTATMLMGYVSTLGSVVQAAATNLAGQNSSTNNSNVQFNSYFEGGDYSTTFEIGSDAKLYLAIQVKNAGYLTNGVVQFSDSNFEIDTENLNNSNVQSCSTSEIKLNQINNSSNQIIIEVPITMIEGETVDSSLFSKVTTVTFTGTYVDSNGKENEIKKEISNQVNWLGTAEIKLAGEVSKFIPYETDQEKGVMLQVLVESGIEENSLPVASTNLEVGVPNFNITNSNEELVTVSPERITVVANTTQGTNGKDSNSFTESNYTYNEQTGNIEIQVTNEEQDGTISWKKDASDLYIITYVYTGEDIYNYVTEQLEKASETAQTLAEGETNEDAIAIEVIVNVNIQAYNSEETSLEKSGKIKYSVEEAFGDLEDAEITATNSVSKGYIYANYAKAEKQAAGETTEDKKDTEYEVSYTAKVYDASITTQVEFTTSADTFMDSEENEYTSSGVIYSKVVKISKDVFSKMLGSEGSIQISTTSGESLGTITQESTEDSDGNYILNIEDTKVSEIVITTSSPITEGEVVVTVEKAISADQTYSKTEMEDFAQINMGVVLSSLPNNEYTTSVNLTEPVSKAEITTDTATLSTVVENDNVEIRVVLDTSSYENALFKNPVLKIVLPENIETVEVTSVDLLLDDELEISNTTITEEDGQKVIQIELTGTQTKYMDNGTATTTSSQNIIATGANIVIKANITFDNLAPSATSDISLYYTNENTDLFETTVSTKVRTLADVMGLVSTSIEIVSPNGVVTESHMSGYDGTNTISNSATESVVETISTNSSSQEVTIGGTIVNNYSNSVENVFVLGRIPYSGNLEIDGTTELGSTFTMAMTEGITLSDIDEDTVKIYYSTNGEATKDLLTDSNGWTEDPDDWSAVKSYLIVLANELATGETFSFDYKVELPANLTYDNSTYTTYKVYYDNVTEDATIGETKVAGTIGLTTGESPNISIELTSTADVVREGQIVKMKATISNTGTKTATNIVVTVPLPDYTTFMDYETSGFHAATDTTLTFTIDELAAGGSEQIYYYLKFDESIVDTLSEETIDELIENPESGIVETETIESEEQESVQINHQISLIADDVSGSVPSNTYEFDVSKGNMSIITFTGTSETQVLSQGRELNYTIRLYKTRSDVELTNTTVTMQLPDGITYESATVASSLMSDDATSDGVTYSESTNTITINVGTLETTKVISMTLKVGEISGGFSITPTATADNIETHYSNITEYSTEIASLEVSELTSTPKYVEEDEDITYTLTITNNGSALISGLSITDTLPEGLTFKQATYTWLGSEQKLTKLTDGSVVISIVSLSAGDSVTVNIVATADVLSDENDKTVTNSVTISANNISSVTTNTVTNVIEYSQTLHDEIENGGSGGSTTTTSRYKITGTAWVDENQDGKRDDSEELLEGIQVVLINKSDSSLVTDVDTGDSKITYTSSTGQYTFSNLVAGEYLVLFIYDAGTYSITEYQADSVDSSYNSDAISMKITLNGEQRYAGVTDTIKITNSNVRDIDIGLYVAEKFDLRLDKYISKVTVTTSSAKVYTYDNTQLVKQDIASKYVGNSTIVIEYKIVVTNEGQVAGYARKIIDYLPDGVKFSSELNQDWYISDSNGTVYNTSLANEKIEPGESKEVTLVLSLSITESVVGSVINNNAEIYESYNDLGLQDYDSIEANMLESEDDMSSANVVISLSTGKTILYTTLTISVIALLGFGIFEIKKRVIDKRKIS